MIITIHLKTISSELPFRGWLFVKISVRSVVIQTCRHWSLPWSHSLHIFVNRRSFLISRDQRISIFRILNVIFWVWNLKCLIPFGFKLRSFVIDAETMFVHIIVLPSLSFPLELSEYFLILPSLITIELLSNIHFDSFYILSKREVLSIFRW